MDANMEQVLTSDVLTLQVYKYLLERGVRVKNPPPGGMNLDDMRELIRAVWLDAELRECPYLN